MVRTNCPKKVIGFWWDWNWYICAGMKENVIHLLILYFPLTIHKVRLPFKKEFIYFVKDIDYIDIYRYRWYRQRKQREIFLCSFTLQIPSRPGADAGQNKEPQTPAFSHICMEWAQVLGPSCVAFPGVLAAKRTRSIAAQMRTSTPWDADSSSGY